MNKLLLIDDDVEYCQILSELLTLEGFSVDTAHDGVKGAEMALDEEFNLVLLDAGLPKIDGFEVLRRVRLKSDIPILMLTARGDEIDRVVGLEMGADDYLAKPFSNRELTARIRAILRRGSTKIDPQPVKITIEDLRLQTDVRQLFMSEELVPLTGAEFLTLQLLVQNAGQLVDRRELTIFALGRGLHEYDRAIDVHLSNLRKKLGLKSDGSQRIKTVRGTGFYYIKSS
ncbi:MAG: response regulator transcription factor [SAR324 cluster bacterium]|nr:response regulator transcription factor [SAR324 cluster bacterium]